MWRARRCPPVPYLNVAYTVTTSTVRLLAKSGVCYRATLGGPNMAITNTQPGMSNQPSKQIGPRRLLALAALLFLALLLIGSNKVTKGMNLNAVVTPPAGGRPALDTPSATPTCVAIWGIVISPSPGAYYNDLNGLAV